jgi:DNA-binding GntR family transcriptional regulator
MRSVEVVCPNARGRLETMPGSRRKPARERPEGLQDFATRHILRAIFTGELGPGDKLSPTKLADELEMSHIPVREALAGLSASGHVRRVPRVGFFVAELSLDYIEDVYHWRQVLEDEAHRIAIPKLSDADLARMRKIDEASSRRQIYSDRYIELRREFHFIPFERAGSDVLVDFLDRLWDASSRYQKLLANTDVSAEMLREQQIGLMEAFTARDVDLLTRRMGAHRGVTLEAIARMVSSLDPQGGARAGV